MITMKKPLAICVGMAGLLGLPGAASAQQTAFTNAPVYVFAGPAPDYPVVSQLPQGLEVTVYGCVAGYTWCDVAVPNLRGWIDASTLSYPYQGANVPILTYGAAIGLPIVTFAVGTYWGSYYRGQPWYHDQERWINHPPPRPGPGPGYGHPPPQPYAGHPPAGHPPGPAPQPYAGHPPGPAPQPYGGHPPEPPHGNPGYAGKPPGAPPGNYGHPPPGPAATHEQPAPEHRGGEEEHGHPPPQ
jgi:uncharacterized protein YraI